MTYSLFVERSVGTQSLALADDSGRVVRETVLDGADCRSGDWTARAVEFAAGAALSGIVCGTGPGSFAGVRAALAFAKGWAIGSGGAALGIPSPCAFARSGRKTAVVGDARRGTFWVALYDGFSQAGGIKAVGGDALAASVPEDFAVFTPDAGRIGETLSRVFGERYAGGADPLAGDLARAAAANPSLVVRDPLPVYLHPAVR